MVGFNENSEQAQAYLNYQRETSKEPSPQLVGKAAAYEAALRMDDYVKHQGLPDDHQKAKKLMTNIASAFVDREVEVKGLMTVDKHRAKQQAQQDISQLSPMDFGYVSDTRHVDQSNRTTM